MSMSSTSSVHYVLVTWMENSSNKPFAGAFGYIQVTCYAAAVIGGYRVFSEVPIFDCSGTKRTGSIITRTSRLARRKGQLTRCIREKAIVFWSYLFTYLPTKEICNPSISRNIKIVAIQNKTHTSRFADRHLAEIYFFTKWKMFSSSGMSSRNKFLHTSIIAVSNI
jgi:hypothetical protein